MLFKIDARPHEWLLRRAGSIQRPECAVGESMVNANIVSGIISIPIWGGRAGGEGDGKGEGEMRLKPVAFDLRYRGRTKPRSL